MNRSAWFFSPDDVGAYIRREQLKQQEEEHGRNSPSPSPRPAVYAEDDIHSLPQAIQPDIDNPTKRYAEHLGTETPPEVVPQRNDSYFSDILQVQYEDIRAASAPEVVVPQSTPPLSASTRPSTSTRSSHSQKQNQLDLPAITRRTHIGDKLTLGGGFLLTIETVARGSPQEPHGLVLHYHDPYISPGVEWNPAAPSPSLNPAFFKEFFASHLCVPIPGTWGEIPPALHTYYLAQGCDGPDGWLDNPQVQRFYIKPFRVRNTTKNPIFQLTGETRCGFRGKRTTEWTLSGRSEADTQETITWDFKHKSEAEGSKITSETLAYNKGPMVSLQFSHGTVGMAGEYDSLLFTMLDGTKYEWRSNLPISNIRGWRYDWQRWALFRLSQTLPYTGEVLPEVLVADASYWNGTYDTFPGNITIRHLQVTDAMVVATLEVMKTRQREILRGEKYHGSTNFQSAQKAARQFESGRLAFWSVDDVVQAKMNAKQRAKSAT